MAMDLLWSQGILVLHLGIIIFNVVGLVVIPWGAWRHWRWVRIFWWRALHLVALFVVALQALLGRACFLTIWQSRLQEESGREGFRAPFIQTSRVRQFIGKNRRFRNAAPAFIGVSAPIF